MRVNHLRLTNSILGWMLVPTYRHPQQRVHDILDALYGGNWLTMPSSERAFMKDAPLDDVKRHVRATCDGMSIGVSFCGQPRSPTIRLFWKPVYVVYVCGPLHGSVVLLKSLSTMPYWYGYKYNRRFTRGDAAFTVFRNKCFDLDVFRLALLSINLEPYHATRGKVSPENPG